MTGRLLARVCAGLAVLTAAMGFAIAVPAAGGVAGAVSGRAAPSRSLTGSDQNGTYLALGDSVAFGYVPPDATPAPNYYDAHSFVSYANDVAMALGERVSNASCPGETTASMLSVTAQSNGCENSVTSSAGYRTFYPLHVEYQGSQMSYAVRYLTVHTDTKLVTIDVGANDAFVCQAEHKCTSTTPAVLAGELEAVLAHEAEGRRPPVRQRALGSHDLGQAGPADQLHDQPDGARLLDHVVDRHDTRVVQPGRGMGLAQRPGVGLIIALNRKDANTGSEVGFSHDE